MEGYNLRNMERDNWVDWWRLIQEVKGLVADVSGLCYKLFYECFGNIHRCVGVI